MSVKIPGEEKDLNKLEWDFASDNDFAQKLLSAHIEEAEKWIRSLMISEGKKEELLKFVKDQREKLEE